MDADTPEGAGPGHSPVPCSAEPDTRFAIVGIATRHGRMNMKVIVDPGRCEGQAVCVGLVPAVFELDDDDEVVRIVVDEVPATHEKLVRKAVRKCPMAALRIEE